MKICFFGAGATGGYLGAELTWAGFDVTLVARGPHLAAMRQNGLTLLIDGKTKIARVACTGDPAEAGPQDYVFLTVKTHSLPPVAGTLKPLLGPETAVVTAQNGIPWWYFYKLGGAWDNRRLESVDPGGAVWDAVGPHRAIGCVVYPSTEVVEPGVIKHVSGTRLMLGEPDGSKSERVVALSKALTTAGFKAPVRSRIRDDIWLKLWGNVSFNPVSVLTHATLDKLVRDQSVRAVIRRMMVEAQAVGERLGASFSVDVDTRIGWAEAVGAHKTSMLQDLEVGRPMEIDALIGVVAEMSRLVDVPTPTIDLVLALVKLRAQAAGRPS